MPAILNSSLFLLHHHSLFSTAVLSFRRHHHHLNVSLFSAPRTTLRAYSTSSSSFSIESSTNQNVRTGRSGSATSPPVEHDTAQKIDVNPPKGTRDFPPEDMRLRNWLFHHFREVSQQFGFEEVDFPVLESEALYIRKAGEEIRDQLYCFEDRGNRRVALRPELTPSLARLVIQKGKSVSLPLKWFAIGQCWRYERMTRGRRREHYQWNMDIIGVPDVTGEAELISSMITFFKRIGLTASDVGFKVSSRKVLQEVLRCYSVPENMFGRVCIIIDKIGKIPMDDIRKDLLSADMSEVAIEDLLQVLSLKSLAKLEEKLGASEALSDLKQLFSLAEKYGYSHPLDVVRTRFQVYDGRISNVPAYRNTPHALYAIARSEGFRGLYAGFYPAVLGSTISWGLYFFFYSKAKQRYLRNREELSPGLHLASAAEAGALVCFCTNPLWLVKTRLQLQTPDQIRPYTGFHDALRTIIKEEGWRALYKGLMPGLFMVTHGAIQFTAYEEFRKFLVSSKAQENENTLATAADLLDSVDYATLGASSKLAAILTTYPFQVVRSRLQQRPSTTGVPRYIDSWHVVKETARFEGVRGFYRGITPNMLKNVPAASVTFIVYETS